MPKSQRAHEQEHQLHDERFPRGMDPPNHMMLEDESTKEQVEKLHLQQRNRWPLTSLLRRAENTIAGVFIHPRHGVTHWNEWAEQPPTWMDPHVLVDMAMEDDELKAALAKGFKQNDVKAYQAVEACLRRVFEEQYLPWMINEFISCASAPLAVWVTNAFVAKSLEKRASRKKVAKA
jgi:hypothetical protein